MVLSAILPKLIGPFYRPLRHQSARFAQKYTHYYRKQAVIKETILYESRDGQSMTDSPRAIFEYLLAHDPAQKYTHIWTIVPSAELAVVQKSYQAYDNVLFVERNSDNYFKWLAQAEYLINNATFQPFFTAKPEQTYINTWHGTPLKVMGYDIPGSPRDARNVVRNFYQMSYFLSPNPHTSQIFLDSYRLREGISGTILEGGYPRIDATVHPDLPRLKQLLTQLDFTYEQDKRIILYAPTWKGTSIGSARDDLSQIEAELAYLRQEHGAQANLLVKVHPFLYKAAQKNTALRPYLIPDVIDTNELLGMVDVLITDYSSIFFDYLVTGKPIIFYTWDEDIYEQERGNYFPASELPGPSCTTIGAVSAWLADLPGLEQAFKVQYQDYQTRFVSYDDGQVTARYVAEIFEQQPQLQIKKYTPNKAKKKLLFYPGGMINNGITSSLVNLVNNLDPAEYDVTCILGMGNSAAQRENISRLPKHVHLLYKFSDSNYSKGEEYANNLFSLIGYQAWLKKIYPAAAYEREMRRLVGPTHYDVAIDFSGYSLFWSKFILATNATRKLVFLHSDMKADQDREVNGKKIHRLNLKGIFSVYRFYDQLISVTSVISKVNQEKLAAYADQAKFTDVPNTLNPAEILAPVVAKAAKTTHLIEKRGGKGLFSQTEVEVWDAKPTDLNVGGQLRKVSVDEEVQLVAACEVDGEQLFKVIYQHIYFGWVRASAGELQETLEEPVKETIDLLGKVTPRNGKVLLYSRPLGLPGSDSLAPVTSLRNLTFHLSERVTTSYGAFYLLRHLGEELGWVQINDVTLYNFYQRPFGKVLGRYLQTKDQTKNRQRYRHLDALFSRYETATGYAQVITAVTLKRPTYFPLVEYEGATVNAEDLVSLMGHGENKAGKFYLVQTAHGQGWLPAANVQVITAADKRLVSENEASFYVELRPEMSATQKARLTLTSPLQEVQVAVDTEYFVSRVARFTTMQEAWFVALTETDGLWLAADQLQVTREGGLHNLKGELIHYPSGEGPHFVTLGRLSPEKDQLSLVQAFGRYYAETKQGTLSLIGEGPMRAVLEAEIDKLGLQEPITLLGHVSQPFDYMRQCDYFVLTSKYEGQSLAILEALTLGLKVLSTDIPACRQVLADGQLGLLTTSNDVTGIYKGLLALQAPETTFATFDSDSYNQMALDKFYRVLT